MPTISIYQNDFEQLLGRSASIEEIESWLPLVKGELKEQAVGSGELRIELQDSNRPDLWCVEGITRQIRTALNGSLGRYSFFHTKQRPKRRLSVSPGLEDVRPYVAACAAVGYAMTEDGLAQFIQTQEKIADIFGRKRGTVSIGLYRLERITFPVTYGLVKPDEARFIPLGFDDKMTLDEILAVHPKGIEYGPILAGCERIPLLWDSDGQALSLPPVINSREIGEVQVGDKELMVEVTGTDLRMVLLTLNIFAANLADRGAAIEPVEVAYPYATTFGKTMRTPIDVTKATRIPVKGIETALGLPVGSELIQEALLSYGYEVKASRHTLSVKLPPYRDDLMHVVDVAEDVAISRGYDAFTPVMPAQFTVGTLSRLEQTVDHVRDLMVGFGFQEVFSNIMTSREDLVDRMRLTGTDQGQVVEVDNVMTQSFACLRSSVLPSLLKVETASPRAFYPHRLFEVGEAAIPDLSQELGSRTLTTMAALIAHPTASFSEAHTYLDLLFYYLVRSYTLEPSSHRSFLDGRVGKIVYDGQVVGMIGEIHPEVLEAWQVSMPIAAFEIEVDAISS